MTHNIKAKLSGLRYKGIITDKEYQRLCKALDTEKKVLEDVKAEIYEYFMTIDGKVYNKSALTCMKIINKYKEDKE